MCKGTRDPKYYSTIVFEPEFVGSLNIGKSFVRLNNILLQFLCHCRHFSIVSIFVLGIGAPDYWHVIVFIPYKYVYNVNITDNEKPYPVILCTFYIQ